MGRFHRFGAALLIAAAGLVGCGGGSPSDEGGTVSGSAPASAEPAAAAADLLELGLARCPDDLTQTGIEVTEPPDGAELTGPHYGFTLRGIAVAEELNSSQLGVLKLHHLRPESGESLRAGTGQEFLIVCLGYPEDGYRGQTGSEVSAEVVVLGEARPVPEPLLDLHVIVVNVPTGADATLAVSDAGETKSISLRTGIQVGDEGHPADTLREGRAVLEEMIRIRGLTPDDMAERFKAVVTVTPYSYLDDKGAAASGHMWVRLSFQLQVGLCDTCVAEHGSVALDLAGSLTVSHSGGEELSIPTGTVVEEVEAAEFLAVLDWDAVYEVPDTVRSFEVRYQTDATFTGDSGTLAYERYDLRNAATIELTERD